MQAILQLCIVINVLTISLCVCFCCFSDLVKFLSLQLNNSRARLSEVQRSIPSTYVASLQPIFNDDLSLSSSSPSFHEFSLNYQLSDTLREMSRAQQQHQSPSASSLDNNVQVDNNTQPTEETSSANEERKQPAPVAERAPSIAGHVNDETGEYVESELEKQRKAELEKKLVTAQSTAATWFNNERK